MHRFPFLALLLLFWAGLSGSVQAQSAALALGDDGTVYVSGTTDSVPGTDVNMPSEFTVGIWPDGSHRWLAEVGALSEGNPVLAIGNGMVVVMEASDSQFTVLSALGPDGNMMWEQTTYNPRTRAVMARLENGDFCYASDMRLSSTTIDQVVVRRVSSAGDIRWTRFIFAAQSPGSLAPSLVAAGNTCVLVGNRGGGGIRITDAARQTIQELPDGTPSLFSVAFPADGTPTHLASFGIEEQRVVGVLAHADAGYTVGSIESDSLRIQNFNHAGETVDSVSWAVPGVFDHMLLRSFSEDSLSVWQWSESPPAVYRSTLSRADGSLRHSTPTLPPTDSLTALLGVEPNTDGYVLVGLRPGHDGNPGPVVIHLAMDGSQMWVYRKLASKPYDMYRASFSNYTVGNHWTYMVENDQRDVGPILTFDILSGDASASEEMRTFRSQEFELDGTLRNESTCSFRLMGDGSVEYVSTLSCSNEARSCRCKSSRITNIPAILNSSIEEDVTVPVGPSNILVSATGTYKVAFSGGTMNSGGGSYTEIYYASGIGPYYIHSSSHSWGLSGTSSSSDTARLEYARVDGVRYGNLAVNTESPPEVPESAFDGVSIYPNPARNTIEVDFQDINAPLLYIEVFDVLGRRVLPSTGATRLDVSGLESGVYLIRISDGMHTRTQSFLKVE